MKVGTKLTIGFIVIVLLIWTIVFVARNTYTETQEEVEALKADIVPGAVAMAEMEGKAYEIKAWTLVYMIRGNVVRKGKPVKEWLQQTTESLERLTREHKERAVVVVPQEAEIAEALETKARQLSSVTREIVNLKDRGVELDELLKRGEEAFGPIFSPLVEQAEEHKTSHMAALAKSVDTVREAHSSSMQFLFLVAGLVTLAAIGIRFLGVRRWITEPLSALHRGTEIIGQGNLDYKVGTKAKDEIGQLSRAFDRMTENLRKTTTSIDNLNKEIAERRRIEAELKEKTEALEQVNIRLQEVDRLKSVFLASMSHELRTPLNSIIGFTDIILQGMAGELNEEQRKQLTWVNSSANHLLSLINDILDISKIEAGEVGLSLEQFRLDDVLREVIETVLPMASLKGIEVITDAPEGIMLFSDRRRIKQVLINLVSNAVKFTNQGSVSIIVRILEDKWLEVRVKDTGIGIKEEDMDKLFVPFQQLDMSLTKKHEGTGLGLHLSKKLVTLLGGDISAKSEYGKESEFSFTLPLKYRKEERNEKSSHSR